MLLGKKELMKTDYGRFLSEARALNAEHIGKIGDLDGVFYDAWRINGHGFIVARNHVGRIGLYAFVGKDGASVEHDITWLRERQATASASPLSQTER